MTLARTLVADAMQLWQGYQSKTGGIITKALTDRMDLRVPEVIPHPESICDSFAMRKFILTRETDDFATCGDGDLSNPALLTLMHRKPV